MICAGRRESRLKHKRTAAAAVAAAIILLSGCANASSVEELLSPPRLDGEQSEIYDALRAFTNEGITLKYPRSGQYRSAFVVQNIDDEPTDEAIVFYEMPNVTAGSSLRINFLDKQNGHWVSVYDFSAQGSEVESIMFRDLGNGTTTIFVDYLVQSSSDRYTSVMSYSGGAPKELAGIRNIYTGIFDTDGNGTDDLFAISSERTSGITSVSIYGFRDEKFTQIGAANLNSGFAEIRSVCCGMCGSSGTRAVFVDYAFSDGSFGTDAVVCGNGFFFLSPALTPEAIVRSSNSYTPYITCTDADGDGSIEIPATKPFVQYEESPRAEQLCSTDWYYLTRNGTYLQKKFGSFVGTKGDYILIFPDSWSGKITASVSIAEGIVRFNRYSAISGVTGENILTLFGAAGSNLARYEGGNYILLGTSPSTGYSYFAQLGNSDLTPTEAELEQLFRLQ